jgi:hypothetical protein
MISHKLYLRIWIRPIRCWASSSIVSVHIVWRPKATIESLERILTMCVIWSTTKCIATTIVRKTTTVSRSAPVRAWCISSVVIVSVYGRRGCSGNGSRVPPALLGVHCYSVVKSETYEKLRDQNNVLWTNTPAYSSWRYFISAEFILNDDSKLTLYCHYLSHK